MIIPRSDGIVTNRQTTSGNMHSEGTQFMSTIGSAAISIAKQWSMQKDEAQYQDAVNTALKKKNEWKASNLTREGKAAEGLTEDYLNHNRDLEEQIGANLSGNARAKFNQWNLRDTEQDKLGVMTYQRKQDEFVKQATFNEGIAISQEGIRLDAKNNWRKALSHAEETLLNGVNSGVIAPEQYETKKLELTGKFRDEAAKSYYIQDKHDFMKKGIHEIGLGETEKAFYSDKYQRDLMAEQREVKSLYAEEAKILIGQKDDMEAQAVANKDTSHFYEGAARLDKMGYKEAAADFRDRAQVYDKVITFQDEHKNKSLSEEREAVAGLKIPEGLDGSSIEYKANLSIAKEYAKKEKLFKSDPAEFVSQIAIGKNDEERAASRLSLQEKQGIMPTKGFQVLTQAEKNAAKAAFETGNIKDKAAIIKDSFKYGKYAPKVISEIGVNKSLALVTLLDNDQDIDLFVAGASGDKSVIIEDEQKSTYTSENKDSEFYQLLADVQGTFPTNEDLPQKISDLDKAMTGISARKVDPSAGKEFMDGKFSVLNEGDKKIYFPKTIDESEIEETLDQRKQEIIQKYSGGKTLNKMAFRETIWVNTQTGYVLADPKTGQALSYPEAEIETLQIDEVRKAKASQIKKNKENAYTQKSYYSGR